MPVDEPGARRIDLRGRTLMPGLIDAHVHMFMSELNMSALHLMPLTTATARAIANLRGMLMRGFTTVRDMAGGEYGMREAAEAGYIDSPRLFVPGRAISQTGGHGDFRSYAGRFAHGDEDRRRRFSGLVRRSAFSG